MKNGFQEFCRLYEREVIPLSSRIVKKHEQEFKRVLRDKLVNSENVLPFSRELNPNENFVYKIINGYIEILNSFDNLQNIEVYIKRFPYNHTRVSKLAYLRYHVENHLNEIYILSERMIAYLTLIKRCYRKDREIKTISLILDALSSATREAFQHLAKIRGFHVHQTRYTDIHLQALTVFEIVSTEHDSLNRIYSKVYRAARKEKIEWINGLNQSIQRSFDKYFGALRRVLFTDEGKLRFPSNFEPYSRY